MLNDSCKCPRCQFEFILDGDKGDCPGCGNVYELKMEGFSFMLCWEHGNMPSGIKNITVAKDSEQTSCPFCDIVFQETLSESPKFYIIRKNCLRCGCTDEEIIRKEAQNA